MSCDLHVFVYEAAQPVSSKHAAGRRGMWRYAACGRVLMQRSVRTMPVVVVDVLLQRCSEVAGSDDQEVVEAFAAQGADEAFRDRVRAGCPDRSVDDADVRAGEHGVERGGELAVSVADQEPEPVGAVAEIHEDVAALLGDPGPVGWAVIPATCTRRRPCSITIRT